MKKIILSLFLFAIGFALNAQTATYAEQAKQTSTLTLIKKGVDTLNRSTIDVTNNSVFKIGGSDKSVFKKNDGTSVFTDANAGESGPNILYDIRTYQVIGNNRLYSATSSKSAAELLDDINAYLLLSKQKLDTLNERARATNTIAAGENHIGQVGGNTAIIRNTITTSTTAYSANDNIGAINTMSGALRISGGTGIIQDLELWDKNAQNVAMYIDYWQSSPSNGTYTDNAAEVIAGDHATHLGTITIGTGDWVTRGAVSRAYISGIGLGIKATSGTSIYFTIYTIGAPTYTTTSGLETKHTILQD